MEDNWVIYGGSDVARNHRPGKAGGKGFFRGLEEALDSIKACSSLNDLSTAMHALTNQLGYAAFTYGEVPRLPHLGPELPFHLTRLSVDFCTTYKSENFIRNDPVWVRAMKRPGLFTWADCPEFSMLGRRGPRTKARKVVEVARDFGYTQGSVIPFHGMDGNGKFVSAMLSLYWKGSIRDFRPPDAFPLWFTMAVRFFHERVMELRGSGSSSATPCPRLTRRECDCLSWVGQGKTFSETAWILGIKARTVEFHIQNAMEKLGVHKSTHAVAIAIRCGLISL